MRDGGLVVVVVVNRVVCGFRRSSQPHVTRDQGNSPPGDEKPPTAISSCSGSDKYTSKEGLKTLPFPSPSSCILSFNAQSVMKHVRAVYLKAGCAACARQISVSYTVSVLSPQRYTSREALKSQNGWGLVLTISLPAHDE